MKNIVKNHYRLIEYLLIVAILLIFEVAFLLRFNIKLYPVYFIITFASITFFPALILFIKSSKARFTLYMTYLFYSLVIFIADSTLFLYKGDLFAISMIFDIGDGLKMGINYNILIAYNWYEWFIIIILIGLLIISLIKLTLGDNKSSSRLPFYKNGLLFFSILVLAFGGLLVKDIDNNIYERPQDKRAHLVTFGFSTFRQRDMVTTLKNVITNFQIELKAREELEKIDKIKLTEDSSITGLYEGKNVIMIMMETVEDFVIDEDLTPTLYYLMNSGYRFTSTYGVARTNNTYDAEFKSLTSMMYYNSDNYMHTYSKNEFTNSLPTILKKNGYTANSFHSNEGGYFNRDSMHNALGFDKFYTSQDMELSDHEFYPLDSDMFLSMKDQISPVQDQPFFSFIITFTTHGPYKEERNEHKTYLDEIKANGKYESNEPEFLNFLASTMDLDKGLEIMIDDLEEKEILDDTLIVLFSDHKNYSDMNMTRKYSGSSATEDEYDYEMDKVPFAIYNPDIEQRHIDEVTSQYDITPTILDLLGIKVVSSYYYGQSIFLYEVGKYEDKPIIIGYNRFIDKNLIVFDKDIMYVNPDIDDFDSYYLQVQSNVFESIEKFHAFFITDYFRETAID